MPFLDVEQLKKVPGERRRVSFVSELPSLSLDGREVSLLKPAHFDLILTNLGDAITVEGLIAVDLQVSCHRCLVEFPLSLKVDFLETYQDKSQLPYHVQEDRVPFEGETIEIEPEVMNAVYLGIPMRLICHEQCRGLCQHCGINLNQEQCHCTEDEFDPRLAKLKNLL